MRNKNKFIKLDYIYYLEIDPLNWILKKKKECQSKNVGKTLGYFSSLESALSRYKEELLKSACLNHVETLVIDKIVELLGENEKQFKHVLITLETQIRGE